MGIYLRYAASVKRTARCRITGLVFFIFAIISGGWVAASPTRRRTLILLGVQLTLGMLVGFCRGGARRFAAALAPRDYRTFLKIGTIVGLAVVDSDHASDADYAGATQICWMVPRPGLTGDLFLFLLLLPAARYPVSMRSSPARRRRCLPTKAAVPALSATAVMCVTGIFRRHYGAGLRLYYRIRAFIFRE